MFYSSVTGFVVFLAAAVAFGFAVAFLAGFFVTLVLPSSSAPSNSLACLLLLDPSLPLDPLTHSALVSLRHLLPPSHDAVLPHKNCY